MAKGLQAGCQETGLHFHPARGSAQKTPSSLHFLRSLATVLGFPAVKAEGAARYKDSPSVVLNHEKQQYFALF